MPKSLVQAVRERYLASIRSVQPPSRWKVLVVDSYTQSLLNSVLKLNEILQQNVSTVENIEHNRTPQPTFEACYLLTPTSANVDRLIRDLAPQQGRSTQYAAGHIFFVDALSESLLQRLTSSPAEPQLRQLLEIFTNLWPLEGQTFSLKTPQSFFKLYQPVGGAYGPDQAEAMQGIEDELFFATQSLLNACVTLNEFPLIRYYNPSHPALGPLAPASASSSSSVSAYGTSARLARLGGGTSSPAPSSDGEHFTKKLALRLQQAIDDYVRDNQPKQDVGRSRGVLFITDRTMDTMAPLLHEFSYQAMANDLLAIEEGTRYRYRFYTTEGKQEDKDATLSDEDAVWTAIRHLHIAEAIDKLSKDFQHHAGEAGAFANDASSLNDMRDMLASLPHMQETKDKLSLHLTMAQDCMSRFEKTRLPQLAMVEQNCSTRLTPEGQKPRTLVEDMVTLLDDRSVSNADKVRIIALYIMYCEGVNDEDKKRLFQHARLSLHEMEAVNNLTLLGVQIAKDPNQSSAWDGWFRNKGKRRQQPTGENEYELSRYQPLVKLMIEDHFAGKLDHSTYPYVKDAPPETASATPSYLPGALSGSGRDSPLARVGLKSSSPVPSNRPTGAPSSLRSAKPTWHQKTRPSGGAGSSGLSDYGLGGASSGSSSIRSGLSIRDETRQRVMVFVAGGMTYSEIRSIYQISKDLNKDGYIGSSHIFTPEGFIESLKQFGKAGNAAGARREMPSTTTGSLGLSATKVSPAGHISGLVSRAQQAVSGSASPADANGRSPSAHSPHPAQQRQQSSASMPPLHQQPVQQPSFDQGLYDRRFGSNGKASSHQETPPRAGSALGRIDTSSSYSQGASNGNSRPSPNRSPHTYSGASGASMSQSYQQGNYNTSGGGTLSQSDTFASMSSIGSSGTNAGDLALAGGKKDGGAKKRMKNVFGFKKG